MAVGLLQQVLDKNAYEVTFEQATSIDELLKFETRLKENLIKEKLLQLEL